MFRSLKAAQPEAQSQLTEVHQKRWAMYKIVMRNNPMVALGIVGRNMDTGAIEDPGEAFWQRVTYGCLTFAKPGAWSILKGAFLVYEDRISKVIHRRQWLKMRLDALVSGRPETWDTNPMSRQGAESFGERQASLIGHQASQSHVRHPSESRHASPTHSLLLEMLHAEECSQQRVLSGSQQRVLSASQPAFLDPHSMLAGDCEGFLGDDPVLSLAEVLQKLQDTFAQEALERSMLGSAMVAAFRPEIVHEVVLLSAPFVTDSVQMVKRLVQAMDEINQVIGARKRRLSLSQVSSQS